MTPFLLYIARAGLYLSLFYAFYLLVMRRTTFFRLNRALVLLGSFLCLVLPSIRLRTEMIATGMAQEPILAGVEAEPLERTIKAVFPWTEVLVALYIAGAAITLTLYLKSAWKMRALIRKGESAHGENCRLVILEEDVPSFSWGKTVVIGRKDLRENPAIFTHEQAHVQHRHSLDLILFLPIQLLFWWNPLVWIAREELRLVHEYEADETVLQKGIDATQYQLLLVRKAVGEQRFSLASGFQHAKLKNRIEMMLKSSSSRWMRWSYLALIPVLAVFMYACNSPKINKVQEPALEEALAVEIQQTVPETVQVPLHETETEETRKEIPFQMVDTKPGFNGGDANEFSKWVNSQLKYPEQAKKDKIQGRITLQFTVGADGAVRNVKVLRSAHELLDAEAVRVISASPNWEPGRQNGEPVAVTYTFPVIFQLG